MSSPFASQLGTNYCPADTELTQIKALLVEPYLRLKAMDDKIGVLREALDKLVEERDALGAYVEAHKALISPVRRLPHDIIEEIFTACLPTHRNCVMSATEAPVLLGRICRSWRVISLSTPRLWSRLHIVEPTRPYNSSPYALSPGLYEAKVTQRLEVANIWLRRSGTCPLSISVESNLDHGVSPPLTPSPSVTKPDLFLNMLIPFASRWRSIRLVVPPSALETLSCLTENDVPLLRRLKIAQRPHHSPIVPQWTLAQCGILNGPSLTKFSLSGSSVFSSDLPLRWSQLTALSLMGPAWGTGHTPQSCETTLDLLSRCPKLETCKLLIYDPRDGYLPDSVVECPFLHTFVLESTGSPVFTSGRLLSRLSLPGLRDFAMHGQADFHGVFTSNSLAMSLAASTHLEAIAIDSDSFSKASLMDFIRSLPPTILCLQITDRLHTWSPTDGALDDDILAVFDTSPDRPAPCPALKKLAMLQCRKVSDEALRTFIIARAPVLEAVDVRFNRDRQIDILPSLESAVAAGLKISTTYISLTPPQFSPWQGLPDPPPGSWGQGWGWPSTS
ncbi:hypothetical protein K438DRAFT_1876203 [Mycena galopus ATCC 62051]|nr:hypothetical protein K438DRAFT_1876203 [Mycena galopus ATCC 62051]